MRKLIVSLVALSIVLSPAQFIYAHGQSSGTTTVEEEVTLEDLGVESAGILPTNPFYFFKEFGRSVRRLMIFNPEARARYELDVLNDKAAELKQVEDIDPENTEAIEKAIENYNGNTDRLRARLEELRETSDNPNIDKLLDSLTERAIRHQQLFDGLLEKHEGLGDRIKDARGGVDDAVLPAIERIDDPEKFKERINRLIDRDPVNGLTAVQIMSRIEGRVDSEEARARLEKIRSDVIQRWEEKISEEGLDPDDVIDRLQGEGADRLRILEDIRDGAKNPNIRARLETLGNEFMREFGEKGSIGEEDAKKMIDEATSLIEKAKAGIAESDEQMVMSTLLREAERHLSLANASFEAEDYGAAFGHANASRVMARNVLVHEEFVGPRTAPPGGEMATSTEGAGVEHEDGERDGRREGSFYPVDIISPLIPRNRESGGTVCTLIYAPVCGNDGKTYSNDCFARGAGVQIVSKGECSGETR